MRRRLFNLAAAVSLLLCVATVALWVRSYWSANYVYYTVPGAARSLDSTSLGMMQRRGVVQLERWRNGDGARSGKGTDGRWTWGTQQVDSLAGEILLRVLGEVGQIGWREPDSQILQIGYGKRVYALEGFRSFSNRVRDPRVCRFVTLPHWVFALMLSIPLAARLSVMLWKGRRSSRESAICPTCGYDLRATPDRCPECGAEPSIKEAHPARA